MFCWYTTGALAHATRTAPILLRGSTGGQAGLVKCPSQRQHVSRLPPISLIWLRARSASPIQVHAFLRFQQRTPVVAQIYTHIYPRGGIVFACVFDYTSFQEKMLISTPLTSMSTDCCHVEPGYSHSLGWEAAQAKGVSYGKESGSVCIYRQLW